jgi:hypothetical protein
VNLVKADLAYREAYVQLKALVEEPCAQAPVISHRATLEWHP